MAPTPCRHTLIWSLPTLAILLTFLWYKSRRGSSRSDPGGTAKGIRKAKRQEYKVARVAANLSDASSEVHVKENDCDLFQKITFFENCSPVTGAAALEPDLPEEQESERHIAGSIVQTVTIELVAPPSSLEASCVNNNIFKEAISKGLCAETVEEKCINCPERKVSQVELPITLKHKSNSSGSGGNSGTIEGENTVEDNFSNSCFESSQQDIDVIAVQKTNCEFAVTPKSDVEDQKSKNIAGNLLQGLTVEHTASPSPVETTCVSKNISKEETTEGSRAEAVEEKCISSTDQKDFQVELSTTLDCRSNNYSVPISGDNTGEDSCLSSRLEKTQQDVEIIAAQEANCEVAVTQKMNSKSVGAKNSNITNYKNLVERSTANNLCGDISCVSHLATLSTNSVEVIDVECYSVKDLQSVAILSVRDNSPGRHIEEGTMPETVRDPWMSENTSDVHSESVSKVERDDTKEMSVAENKVSQKEDSEATEPSSMQTPQLAKETSEMDSVAASGSCGLEGKLAALELGKGRDSANHSPAEVMLASPSASSYSDEGSSDSGKGCSDLATPPSRTPASGSSVSGDATVFSVYEFVLPQHLVGRLIGRHGAFVHQIKAKTNASILIKRHPDTTKLKICAVEGTQLDIDGALEMIRKKFPLKHYPSITLEQVCFVPPVPIYPILPECLQLMLVEGVNNDVILSSLVTPGHFFLQQPTHPTFPSLNRLNACMNICYCEPNVPLLPTPVDAGVICAAPAMGGWYRAQVVSVDSENDTAEVKFVDYGGYLSLEHTALRQIRSDFMTLPFQASECFLANVVPSGGEEASWSPDAAAVMEELTHGQVLQAQVCDYSEENIPNVLLYAVHCNQVVLINQELVSRGHAVWWQAEEINDASCS